MVNGPTRPMAAKSQQHSPTLLKSPAARVRLGSHNTRPNQRTMHKNPLIKQTKRGTDVEDPSVGRPRTTQNPVFKSKLNEKFQGHMVLNFCSQLYRKYTVH